uniref:Putative Cytochrome-c peroxidase n=1 Tax=mine drainage metagenome TaxID=410659 RepID=E6PV15_9ZZZZ
MLAANIMSSPTEHRPTSPAAPRSKAPATRKGRRWARWIGGSLVALTAVAMLDVAAQQPELTPMDWLLHPIDSATLALGDNPHPVPLLLPPNQPLSAAAQLGRQLFFDTALSASGKQSCASCHDPSNGYNPPLGPVMLGGPHLTTPGYRPPPSLAYLYRQQNFSIGPDNAENETITLQRLIQLGQDAARITKTAQSTAVTAQNLVPQGGLFWDGRANTLQQQADGPLFNPVEMDAGSPQRVAAILQRQPYAKDFTQLFGPNVFLDPQQTVAEALFAIARYQIEDPSFHPFTSQYDAWLQGKARLNAQQMRGYLAFNDVHKGNCAACHLDKPTANGLPPLFTDTQYEALGVPRNPHIPANKDPRYVDLGLCGPFRTDLKNQTQYCGMFLTPTLRNVAQRPVYFHNGVYHDLKQVLDFYNFRDVQPQTIYPVGADGKVEKYNDLPAEYHANIDTIDPPFNRKPGEKPAMSAQDMRDIIAFLKTLNDGWHPSH